MLISVENVLKYRETPKEKFFVELNALAVYRFKQHGLTDTSAIPIRFGQLLTLLSDFSVYFVLFSV